jgi:hypothetical protein
MWGPCEYTKVRMCGSCTTEKGCWVVDLEREEDMDGYDYKCDITLINMKRVVLATSFHKRCGY